MGDRDRRLDRTLQQLHGRLGQSGQPLGTDGQKPAGRHGLRASGALHLRIPGAGRHVHRQLLPAGIQACTGLHRLALRQRRRQGRRSRTDADGLRTGRDLCGGEPDLPVQKALPAPVHRRGSRAGGAGILRLDAAGVPRLSRRLAAAHRVRGRDHRRDRQARSAEGQQKNDVAKDGHVVFCNIGELTQAV